MAVIITVPAGSTYYGSSIGNNMLANVYGTASNFTVTALGGMVVFSAGSADFTEVGNAGSMFVSSGGIVTKTALYAGAVINGFTIGANSFMTSGVTVSGVTVENGDDAYLYQGQSADAVRVSSGAVLMVSSGGSITSLQASAGADIKLYDGAFASNAVLASGATVNGFLLQTVNEKIFNLSSATVATEAYLYSGQKMTSAAVAGTVNISSGGVLSSAVLSGVANVFAGGALSSAVNSGTLNIISGSASSIENYGQARISQGAVITGFINNNGAQLQVFNGGFISSATISGGSVNVSGSMHDVSITGGSMTVNHGSVTSLDIGKVTVSAVSGAFIGDAVIGAAGRLGITDGVVSTLTVENGGILAAAGYFAADIVFDYIIVHSEYHSSSGPVLSNVVVSSGGVVNTTMPVEAKIAAWRQIDSIKSTMSASGIPSTALTYDVQARNNFANLTLSSGAIINGFTAIETNEIASTLKLSNVVVKNGATANLYDESVSNAVVSSGGLFNVSKYFSAEAADLTVSSGGSVNVQEGGILVLTGKTQLDGSITLKRHIALYAEKYLDWPAVLSGTVTSQYYSPNILVSSAIIYGTSKTRAQATDDWPTTGTPFTKIIDPYKAAYVSATVNNPWYNNDDPDSATQQKIYDGSSVFQPDAYTSPVHGSQAILRVDFRSAGLAANEAMINDMSKISVVDTGVSLSTLSLLNDQRLDDSARFEFVYSTSLYDAYVIADGAAGFGNNNSALGIPYDTFRIVDANGSTMVDSIAVGDSGTSGTKTFYLKRNDGLASNGDHLYMEIYDSTSGAATITTSPGNTETDYINTSFTVTAQFSQNTKVGTKQYRIAYDDGASVGWTDYLVYEGVVMAKNGTITFRGTGSNNASDTETVTVKGIDISAPVFTGYTQTQVTNKTYNVKATVVDNEVLGYTTSGLDPKKGIQYSLTGNDDDWHAYSVTDGITVDKDATIHFRTWDKAGNYGEGAYTVAGIDTKAPEIFSVTPTALTNTDVLITLKFDSAATQNQVSVDGGLNWGSLGSDRFYTYHATQNGTYLFRSYYAAGDMYSEVQTYEVTNIDKIKPEKPVVTVDPEDIVSQVTLTVDWEEETSLHKYSFTYTQEEKDDPKKLKKWADYTGPQKYTANRTVYFCEIDAAGNISDVTEYKITNIAVCNAPVATVSTEDYTSDPVYITVSKVTGTSQPMIYQYQFVDNGGSVDPDAWITFDYAASQIEVDYNTNVHIRAVQASDPVYSSPITVVSVTNIDTAAPVIDPLIYSRTASDGGLTVTVTASDETLAGVKTLEYTLDNGITWTVFETEPVDDYTVTGSFTLGSGQLALPVFFKVRATDQVGNVSYSPEYGIDSEVTPSTDTWTNSDVTVAFSAFSVPADVAEAAYSFDGGSNWTELVLTDGSDPGWKVGSFVLEENQDITFRAIDADGNVYVHDVYSYNWIDKDPAVLTVTGWEDWTNKPVTVEVTAEDYSGIAEAVYTFNGQWWAPIDMNPDAENPGVYRGSFTKEEFGPFQVRVTDLAGNVTLSKVNNVRYDGIAPEIVSVTPSRTEWSQDPVTVTVAATDDRSGVAKMEYTFNGSWWEEFDGSFELTEYGPYQIQVTDIAGNVTKSGVYSTPIDKENPVIDSVVWDAETWSPSVTVTVTASDALSGVGKMYFTSAGSPWAEFEGGSFQLTHNGPFAVKVVDKVGNETISKTYSTRNIDSIAPSIDSVDWNRHWTNSPVEVTVSASDDYSGLAKTEYSLDEGASWTEFTDTFVMSENGAFQLRVTDKAGNVTLGEDEVANIDTAVPTVDSIDWDTEWTKDPVSVTVVVSDDLSGIALTEYTLDDGETWTAFEDRFVLSENGTFKVRATDNAGNVSLEEEREMTNIDVTAPAIADPVFDTAWTNGPITVSVTADDFGQSGVVEMWYTFNGKPWAQFADSETGSFTVSGNGPFAVKAIDAAGNEGKSKNYAIQNYDNIAPTVDSVSWPGEWTNGESVTIEVETSDDYSGVAKTYFTFNGTPWAEFDGSFELTQNGPFQIKVVDNAGNAALSKVYNVKTFDRVNPLIDAVTWDSAWTNGAVTVTVAAHDAPADAANKSSGIGKMYYTANSSPWIEFEGGSFDLTANGPFQVKVEDNAGNWVLSSVFSITSVDVEAPVISDVTWDTAWTNGPVTVNFTVTDNLSGVAALYYTTNGGPLIEFSGTSLELTHNGPFMIKAVDNAGNEGFSKVFAISNIDLNAPTVNSITWDTVWTNQPVEVSVTATDDFSGVAKKEYTLDGGAEWTEFTDTFEVSENGTFQVRVTDNAGNVKVEEREVTNIDTGLPDISIELDPAAWTVGNVTVYVTATSALSGIAKTEYSLNGGLSWTAFTENFLVSENGTVQVRATDNAGNVNIEETEVSNIDRTAPVIADPVFDTAWTNAPITVSVTADDFGQSGVVSMWYTFKGQPWKQFADSETGSFDVAGNGLFAVKVIDAVGHETVSKNYNIRNYDSIQPTIDSITWNTEWTKDPVTVSVTASDDYSGLGVFEYSLDGGAEWTEFTDTFQVSENGVFQVRVTDKAGNETIAEREVTNIDSGLPAIAIALDPVDWTNAAVTVSVTVDAGVSGVAKTEYSLDGGLNWTVFTDTFKVSANGTVQVRATDKAGNANIEETEVTNIDVTAPAIADPVFDTAWTNAPITISVTADDFGQSGVVEMWYTFKGKQWAQFADSETGSFTVSGNGPFAIKAIDAAGNVRQSKNYAIANYDNIAPTVDNVFWPGEWTNGESVTIEVETSDDYSGVAKTYFTFNGTPWAEFDGSFELTQNGPFQIKVVDKAGNSALSKVYNTKTFDRANPLIDAVSWDAEWTNGNVTVSVTAHDAPADAANKSSGIGKMYYTANSSPWIEFEGSFELTENGPFQVKVEDNAGNAVLSSVYGLASIDRVSPVIDSVTWDPAWTNQDVTVTVMSSDDLSGVAKTEYSLDGIDWTEFTDSFAAADNGGIQIRATDNAGNVSEVSSIVIENIDRIDPEIISIDWDRSWTNEPVEISVEAQDAESGIGKMEFSTDGIDWTEFADTFEIGDNGMFFVRVSDKAGNAVIQNEEVDNIDMVSPAIESIDYDNTTWTNQTVVVSVISSDEQSRVAKMEYSFNAGEWTEFSGELKTEGNFEIAENGIFQIRVTDNAGNEEFSPELQVSCIDLTGPVVDSVTWDTSWTNGPIEVSVTASDDLSGVVKTEYTFRGSGWTEFTDSFTVEHNGSLQIRVTDHAGNVTRSGNYNIRNFDNNAPTVDSVTWNTDWTNAESITVTVKASDDFSGVAKTYYTFSGTPWTEFDGSFELSANGPFQVKVVDNAGNEKLSKVYNIKTIDRLAPVINEVAYSGEWTNGNVTVTVEASDLADTANKASGIGKMYYTFSGTPWTEFDGSFELSANGPFQVKVEDNAGNKTLSKVYNIKTIDRLAPVIDSVTWDDSWTNSPISVTAAAHDEADAANKASGIAMMEYSFDGSAWTEFTDSFIVEHNGSLQVRATDHAGNVTLSGSYNIRNFDSIAPTINSIEWDQDWTNGNVTVNVVASDDYSGVAKTYYTFSGTPWTEFDGSFELTANGPFMVKAVDKAGNETLSKVYNIKTIDRLAPVIDTIDYSNEWTNADAVTVSVTAHDEADAASKASGVAAMYYTFSGKPWTEFDGTFELSANGPFQVKVVDNAGNEKLSKVYNIKSIDRLAPTVDSVTWDKAWTNQPIEVTVAVSDLADAANKASGIAKTEYTFNGSWWAEFTDSFTIDHNGPFQVRVTDNAGNVTLSDNCNIWNYDSLVPTINSITWNQDWTNVPVVVTVETSDDYSGVALVEYTLDGGTTWTEFTDTFEVSENGTFQVRVTDKAGNETLSDEQTVANIDTVDPTLVSVVPDFPYWRNDTVYFTVTVSDDASGVSLLEYSADNGETWTEIELSDSEIAGARTGVFSADDNPLGGKFLFQFSDVAGNEATGEYAYAYIDKIAPYIESVSWDYEWTELPVKVTVSTADDYSGVYANYYSVDGGINWEKITDDEGTSFEFADGLKFQIGVRDNAGNFFASDVIPVDVINPVIESISWDETPTTGFVPITVSAFDTQSGLDKTCYTLDGSMWIEFSNVFVMTRNGSFMVKAVDKAGNEMLSDRLEVTNIVPAQSAGSALSGEELESWSDASALLSSPAVSLDLGGASAADLTSGLLGLETAPVDCCIADTELNQFGTARTALSGLLIA